MTTKPLFNNPKRVLVFNGAQTLIAVFRSLHTTSDISGCNLQALSFCCTGKYISTAGLYFRHMSDDVIVEIEDIGTLQLQEYDKLCGTTRRYHNIRVMAKKRKISQVKNVTSANKKGGINE